MTETSDERRNLADIIALATVLSHSAQAFAEEIVGSIEDGLREADTLLPDEMSWAEETADDGSVVKRYVCYQFDPYLGAGEEIPVIDELQAILDVDDWSSALLSKYGLSDNESLQVFCISVIERSAVFLLEYRGKVGEFTFDGAFEYQMEGSPLSSWSERDVAEHFLSLCAEELRRSALQVTYDAFVHWVSSRSH